MYDEDKIKDIFAYYGRAMCIAQSVEKGIMCMLLLPQRDNFITQSRYDELLYEKSSYTFGQLKRELLQLNIFTDDELNKLDEFHKKRDFLVHNYWWDRSVELYDPNLQHKLFDELEAYTIFFIEINEIIKGINHTVLEKNNINLQRIQEEMIAEGETPILEPFRKLKKSEVLVDLFGYRNNPNSYIPIFQLDDLTYWTLCEVGLTQYKEHIVETEKVPLKQVDGLFPIVQFNPRPAVNTPWKYQLDLKKRGLKVDVEFITELRKVKWKII
ncbi:hypothetical protein FVR03_20235 [Pontibacter qinzhouensis]|uniref:Uncharacterized protein n=1 Tax=Pontibacter qinzhouensis TaxID=2603253 RepID=A0A5C8J468_9BACT|nr:hypothetical protein [Pontibacter qinzhouensis]TXK30872.1 hypothetical protein FVR03_20235 [Pontibacter qinzhouensis]